MMKMALEGAPGANGPIGQAAVGAVARSDRSALRDVTTVMGLAELARTAVFESLTTAGFEDVSLPSSTEEAAIISSGLRDTASAETEPRFPAVQAWFQGFREAAFVTGLRLEQSVREGNISGVEEKVRLLQAIGRAWVKAETVFLSADVRDQAALQFITGAGQVPGGERDAYEYPWVGVMQDAVAAGREERRRAGNEPLPRQTSIYEDLDAALQRYQVMSWQEVLRDLRVQANLTQAELAQRAGEWRTGRRPYSVSYVSAVERQQISPSLGALFNLIRGLGVGDVASNVNLMALVVKILQDTRVSTTGTE